MGMNFTVEREGEFAKLAPTEQCIDKRADDLPNAPPLMAPTARSSTLPRITNALNSFNMICLLDACGLRLEFYGSGRRLSTKAGR
jgi:hypothetical protein